MYDTLGRRLEKNQMTNEEEFGPMKDDIPSNVVQLLRACTIRKDLGKAFKLHAYIWEHKLLGKSAYIGTMLVNMYAKCGVLSRAQLVLKELPVRNVVSWNAVIAGYVQQGQGEEALKWFDNMLYEGYIPTAVTFTCILKACGSIKAAAKGEDIHAKIVSLGMLEKDVMLGSALVDMYAKCGALDKAQQVLEELTVRDVYSWSALIAGYAQQGRGEKALRCFDDMLCEGHSPTTVTFVCVLKACGSTGAAAKGKEIHGKIVSLGMLEQDIVLGTALVGMYAQCGALAKAQSVLEGLPIRCVVTWNVLIAGYARCEQGDEVLKCFHDMLSEGHSPTAVTFVCVLKACGSKGEAAKGEEIHDKIAYLGMLEKNIVLGNALLDMYVKCSALGKAQQVLEELPVRNVISWSALLAGYAQQGQGEEALKCFTCMLQEGQSPDVITFLSVLNACGSIGATAKGQEIHGKIVSLGMLERNFVLRNALVDTYLKCSAVSKAQQVLEEFCSCDVTTWNMLVSGYAQQGQSAEAIDCFEMMQVTGVKPNLITLTSVLNACIHSGLLDQAETYFLGMTRKYGIHPNLDHYCCMIDLFSRAGKLDKTLSMIAEMPSHKCLSSWVTLLGACRQWGEVNIGRLAFERAVHVDERNAVLYVLVADMYKAAGRQQEVVTEPSLTPIEESIT